MGQGYVTYQFIQSILKEKQFSAIRYQEAAS
jgi:hypothetical protein